MKRQTTDLTPRMPFPVHPEWYESHWYGDRQTSHAPSPAVRFGETWAQGMAVTKLIAGAIGRAARSFGQLTAAL